MRVVVSADVDVHVDRDAHADTSEPLQLVPACVVSPAPSVWHWLLLASVCIDDVPYFGMLLLRIAMESRKYRYRLLLDLFLRPPPLLSARRDRHARIHNDRFGPSVCFWEILLRSLPVSQDLSIARER